MSDHLQHAFSSALQPLAGFAAGLLPILAAILALAGLSSLKLR